MVDDDAYCADVMKQIAAVQGLLEAATRLVLRKHLKTCVADAIRAGQVDPKNERRQTRSSQISRKYS
jgi:DNA-binding FrmR family transcriptional regulator